MPMTKPDTVANVGDVVTATLTGVVVRKIRGRSQALVLDTGEGGEVLIPHAVVRDGGVRVAK